MFTLLSRKIQVSVTFWLFAVTLALMSGCARTPEPPKAEEPPVVATAPPDTESRTKEAVSVPPPTADEVRTKLNFIFDGAVTLDASRTPCFFAGDFNSDGSQDLALIVQPVETKLPDINSEVANWILGDPTQVMLPDPTRSVQALLKLKPVQIERTDSQLFALIHGHGPDGWRDPLARQTYLLKNAVGRNPTAQSVTELVKASYGKAKKPAIFADMSKEGKVIKQGLRGAPGFLYYTGAKYVWYELN